LSDKAQIEITGKTISGTKSDGTKNDNIKGSGTTKSVLLKQLDVKTNFDNGGNTSSNDTLEITVFEKGTNNTFGKGEYEVEVKINGTLKTYPIDDDGKVRIPFDDLDQGKVVIEVVAKKGGFVDSEKKIVEVNNDSKAPEIVSANYVYGQYRNNKRDSDTLVVTFNEPIIFPNADTTFWIWDGENSYSVKVSVHGNDGNRWVFVVVSTEREPKKGDKINIWSNYVKGENTNTAGVIRDNLGNYVQKNNPKVELNIKFPSPNVDLYVFVGKDKDDLAKEINSSDNLLNSVKNNPGSGTIIIIDPGFPVSNEIKGEKLDQLESIYAVILDPVGNKVNETEELNIGEHFRVVIANVGNSGSKYLTAVWTNKNSQGRDVGAGTYMLIIKSTWNDSGTIESKSAIPVKTVSRKR
jgi:hypothetical protein